VLDDAFRAELEHSRSRTDAIAAAYEARDFVRALVEVRDLADRANQLFDAAAPWKTIKTDPEAARATLTGTLNLFRALAIYLKPVLPVYAEKVERLFGEAPYTWNSLADTLENRPVGAYEYLAQRIEPEKIDAMVAASRESLPGAPAPKTESEKPESRNPGIPENRSPGAPENRNPGKPEIPFSDFDKIDLRVARVLEAGLVEGSDKLVRFKLSLGPLGERQIFSGIRAAYPDPSVLVGKDIVIVANLAPRKMRFGVSEGMVLSAGADLPALSVLTTVTGVQPGDPVA
jgi:methionyl-tRNA synthetase